MNLALTVNDKLSVLIVETVYISVIQTYNSRFGYYYRIGYVYSKGSCYSLSH